MRQLPENLLSRGPEPPQLLKQVATEERPADSIIIMCLPLLEHVATRRRAAWTDSWIIPEEEGPESRGATMARIKPACHKGLGSRSAPALRSTKHLQN